jgi:hypothetical protein
MEFYSPGGSELLSNLRNFQYILNTSTFNLGGRLLGSNQGIDGTVTSIQLVSTPEPGALAVFAMLGIAGVLHRRQRR